MGVQAASKERLASLQRRIAALEGLDGIGLDGMPRQKEKGTDDRLALGLDDLDRPLGGGLVRAALHELRCAESRAAGELAGFAMALLVRLSQADRRPFLWVAAAHAEDEGATLYGPGLRAFGLDPARIVIMRTRRPEEALWVFEEGLRCRALAGAVAEIHGQARPLDLTASRRLALRARDEGVMGILLRPAASPEPGAALTRWLLTPRRSRPNDGFAAGIGRPAWRLDLERNRLGPTGRFDVEWDHEQHCFVRVVATLPVAGPLPAQDRPASPPELRPELAIRRAG